MKGRLKDLMFGGKGEQYLTLTLSADFRRKFDELKDAELDIEIKKHREKRSLDANAYFHLLVNKIAENQGISDEEVKRSLVCDYGTYAKDENGDVIGFKLPASVDVSKIYPYTRCFDDREENGKLFKCYLVYKRTHDMNTAEFTRLIDGAIYEAKNLGIETDTPERIAQLRSMWEEIDRKEQNADVGLQQVSQ